MNEKPRLKPCPFCKGKPSLGSTGKGLFDWISPSYLNYQVLCKCGVRGPVFSEHRHFAVQGWNRMTKR